MKVLTGYEPIHDRLDATAHRKDTMRTKAVDTGTCIQEIGEILFATVSFCHCYTAADLRWYRSLLGLL